MFSLKYGTIGAEWVLESRVNGRRELDVFPNVKSEERIKKRGGVFLPGFLRERAPERQVRPDLLRTSHIECWRRKVGFAA